jgi:hypothetical protein
MTTDGAGERRGNKNAAVTMFKKVLGEVPLDCRHCGVRLAIDTPNMRSFWETG